MEPEKLKCMGAVLLQLKGHDKTWMDHLDDHLFSCLNLLSRKFSKVLMDGKNVHQILDSMNIVLGLMAAMEVTGWRDTDIA